VTFDEEPERIGIACPGAADRCGVAHLHSAR
jgi:hypothetical protein